jgi:hypothetical protein
MLFASRKLAFVLLLAALALGASGCNSNAKKIVGKWKMTGLGNEKAKGAEGLVAYLEFKSDGTGQFGIEITDPKLKEFFGDAKDMTAGFKYKVSGDTLELTELPKDGKKGDSPFKSDRAKGKIKFDNNDTLTLTPDDPNEKPVTLTRMK